MKSQPSDRLNQRWMFFFSVWLLFLSGVFAHFFGPPGVLQAFRLDSLLNTKKELLTHSNEDLLSLKVEIDQLENNRFVQEREIRRILGYSGNDEMIFDFGDSY